VQLVLMQITKQGRWRRAQTHLMDMNAPMMLLEGGERGRKCLVLLGYLNLLEGTPALTKEARYLVQVRFMAESSVLGLHFAGRPVEDL